MSQFVAHVVQCFVVHLQFFSDGFPFSPGELFEVAVHHGERERRVGRAAFGVCELYVEAFLERASPYASGVEGLENGQEVFHLLERSLCVVIDSQFVDQVE